MIAQAKDERLGANVNWRGYRLGWGRELRLSSTTYKSDQMLLLLMFCLISAGK